tara:strand:+ start:951 stop:1178 length:228 start_codon:yes stop_codon:yes gene_type:complete
MKWISKIMLMLAAFFLIFREILSFGRGMIYYFNYGTLSYGWFWFADIWGMVLWVTWQLFLLCFLIAAITNLFAKK